MIYEPAQAQKFYQRRVIAGAPKIPNFLQKFVAAITRHRKTICDFVAPPSVSCYYLNVVNLSAAKRTES